MQHYEGYLICSDHVFQHDVWSLSIYKKKTDIQLFLNQGEEICSDVESNFRGEIWHLIWIRTNFC